MVATLAPAALAGGMHAKVEGPAKDGRTYTVRTYQCSDPANLKVAVWAEGLVSGKRQTLPLAIKKTSKAGVFQFTRNWPASGEWMLRVQFPGAHAPVTLTELNGNGSVRTVDLIWEGDGVKQCEAILSGKS
jgi:hypothetical protein